jgi:hypothetical protein
MQIVCQSERDVAHLSGVDMNPDGGFETRSQIRPDLIITVRQDQFETAASA